MSIVETEVVGDEIERPTVLEKYAQLFGMHVLQVFQQVVLHDFPDVAELQPQVQELSLPADSTCARRDCSIREIIWTYLLYFTNYFGILSHFSDKRKMLLENPQLIKETEIQIELPSGSCMLIRKELFREIGYFDPNTFLYYEENILYRKLMAVNKTNYMLPGISCIHLGGVTTNKVPHTASYMKSSKSSGYYYATHYRNLNILQKITLKMAFCWYNCMVRVVKFFKRQ